MDGRAAARIAAPVAFLVLVTVAVLLVRAGLREGTPAPGPVAVTTGSPARVVIRKGDTLERIAVRTGTTVAVLRQLNPGVDPVELRPGQRLRVR